MSDQFLFPWISSGVLIGLAGAAIVWRMPEAETARRWAVIALTAVLALLLAASYEASLVESARLIEPWIGSWFTVDALNEIPLPLFAALALGVTILAPKRKVTPRWLSGILILTAATLAAYAANNLLVLTLAWAATIAPFLSKRFFDIRREKETPSWSKVVLGLSAACVLIGAVLLVAATVHTGGVSVLSLSLPRAGTGTMLRCAFGFLMVAVFLRKGLLPAHSWLLAGFERGPLLPLALLVNGHLGAFLIARVFANIERLVERERDAIAVSGANASFDAAGNRRRHRPSLAAARRFGFADGGVHGADRPGRTPTAPFAGAAFHQSGVVHSGRIGKQQRRRHCRRAGAGRRRSASPR